MIERFSGGPVSEQVEHPTDQGATQMTAEETVARYYEAWQ